MADRFEDERGVIQDILGPIDCVTRIFTVRGGVRGNHVHKHTTQWTYVLYGKLLVVTEQNGIRLERAYKPGDLCCEEPGTAHAWKALEDTAVLVFARGPRAGEHYESDTFREGIKLL